MLFSGCSVLYEVNPNQKKKQKKEERPYWATFRNMKDLGYKFLRKI